MVKLLVSQSQYAGQNISRIGPCESSSCTQWDPDKQVSSGVILKKPWWSWLRLMDSHLETLRSKPILIPSALNSSTSATTIDLVLPHVTSFINSMDKGRTTPVMWDELPGITGRPLNGVPLLGPFLRQDKKFAKLQSGMVAVRQLAEFVQLGNHFCYTFEHAVSMETVKRITEVKFDNKKVARHAFHEVSNSAHHRLASSGSSNSDLYMTKIA